VGKRNSASGRPATRGREQGNRCQVCSVCGWNWINGERLAQINAGPRREEREAGGLKQGDRNQVLSDGGDRDGASGLVK